MNYLLVFIGGGLGSAARYLLSKTIYQLFSTVFPLGTMTVNFLGCITIGFLYGLFDFTVLPPELRIFCLVGFLGGFTTFSSFGLETVNLILDKELLLAIVNILLSNLAGLALVYGGIFISRFVFRHLN